MEGKKLEEEGCVWFRGALGTDELSALDRICAVEGRPGKRLEKNHDLSCFLGAENSLAYLAQQVLPDARPVRAVIFNKSETGNWSVPWHQDRVIAVDRKYELDGYSSWSNKFGTWHVEPPEGFLRGMFFARIHLDDTDETNGCLELAVGTHKAGRILAGDVSEAVAGAPIETCRAERGDILFVKALTLHRSQRAQVNTQRRTLRVDYCAQPLPKPLHWAL